MSKKAFSDTSCDNCGEFIAQYDPIYFLDGEKFCYDCAKSKGIVCKCDEQKKKDFAECYACHVGKLKGKG